MKNETNDHGFRNGEENRHFYHKLKLYLGKMPGISTENNSNTQLTSILTNKLNYFNGEYKNITL